MSASGDTAAKSDQVRAYVEQILASPAFSASARRAQLLRYLVERGIAGEADRVNEYAIGVDVFGKPESFDPRMESTVRAEFSRLRQKIKEYYAAEGSADPIRIDFLPRSYVPVFNFSTAEAFPGNVAVENVARESVSARRFRRGWLLAAVAGVALAGSGFAAFRFLNHPVEPIRSIVVLPFANLSPDHNDDYLADGLTEELTNDLAQSKDLRVLARTSASLFKGKAVDIRDVGRRLNVDTAIEGSVERQGDRLRITAQMNRTSDGYHVWSHSYDSSARDLLAVQAEISRAIAAAVAGSGHRTVEPYADSTKDPEAHDLYLRANYQLSLNKQQSFQQALALFTQATERDPAYVNAWIGIARTELSLLHLSLASPDQAFPAARAALDKALQLDPSCGDARGVRALLIASYDWDWPRAEQEFRRAIADGAGAPAHAFLGLLLAIHGRFPEAHTEVRLAEDLDPLGTSPRFNEYMVFIQEHDYSGAKNVLHGMLEQHPDQFDVHFLLGEVAVIERNCAEAHQEMDWCARQFPSTMSEEGLAEASACEGDQAEARSHLAKAAAPGEPGYASPYLFAAVYATIGDKEKAFSMLNKSAEMKEMPILYMKYSAALENLHSDPRFLALEKRVGLEP